LSREVRYVPYLVESSD
jgi:hypothetical protein